jgi:hypothetical protein
MAGQYGTKETQELLYLVKCIALPIVREVKKDGFQKTDLLAFLKSAEFEKALEPAIAGADAVPSELGELDLRDNLALGRYAYDTVMDIVEEIRATTK